MLRKLSGNSQKVGIGRWGVWAMVMNQKASKYVRLLWCKQNSQIKLGILDHNSTSLSLLLNYNRWLAGVTNGPKIWAQINVSLVLHIKPRSSVVPLLQMVHAHRSFVTPLLQEIHASKCLICKWLRVDRSPRESPLLFIFEGAQPFDWYHVLPCITS
jgi:hypothetical protein